MVLGIDDSILILVTLGLVAIFVFIGLLVSVLVMRRLLGNVHALCDNVLNTQAAEIVTISNEREAFEKRFLSTQAAATEAMNVELATLQAGLTNLHSQLESDSSEREAFEKRFLSTQAAATEAMNVELATLQAGLTNLHSQIESGAVEVASLADGIKSLQVDVTKLYTTVKYDSGEVFDLVSNINAKLLDEIKTQKENYLAVTNGNTSLTERLNVQAKQLEELETLRQEYSTYYLENASLTERLKQSDSSAVSLKEQLETAVQSYEQLLEKRIFIEQEVEGLRIKVELVESQLDGARQQLEETQVRTLVAEEKLNEAEKAKKHDLELLRILFKDTQNELLSSVDRVSAIETEMNFLSPMLAIGEALKSIARIQEDIRTESIDLNQNILEPPEIAPQPLIWTRALVDKFWNGVVQTRINESSFMSTGGLSVIHLLQRFLRKSSKIVDYGSGSGQLAEALLGAGYRCAIVEPAVLRFEANRKRLEGYENFLGGLDETSNGIEFDAIVMCEVIEHILDSELVSVMSRVASFLKPESGRLLLTCPYDEDLELNSVLCPVTGLVYHRHQHVRSLRPETLAELLEPFGFQVEWVGIVNFESDSNLKNWVRKTLPKNKPIPAPVKSRDGIFPSMENPTNIFMVCSRAPIGKNKPRRSKIGGKVSDSTLVAVREPVVLEKPFMSMGGHGYVSDVHELRALADDNQHGTISPVRIYEDGN